MTELLDQLVNRTISEIQFVAMACKMPVTVAFSGGKDSIVLWSITKRALRGYNDNLFENKVKAQFNLTSIDHPEVIYFIRKHYPEVVRVRPKRTMWQLIPAKRIPPLRIKGRYCCRDLKEKRIPGVCLTGIRREESLSRAHRTTLEASSKNCILFHPLLEWSEYSIWSYIDANKLPYPSLYEEEGIGRIGCIGCPMGGVKQREVQFTRYPKYKAAYIRAMDRCVKKRIKDGLKTTWTSGQEMFDWWMRQ